VDNIPLMGGLVKPIGIGSKMTFKNLKSDKKSVETKHNLLPWRERNVVERIRKTSVEAKSLITENVFIEPSEIGDLITVMQKGTFTYTYATEQIFTLFQNHIDTKNIDKAKQIINQVLIKKMKQRDIVNLNETEKNEIVGEVTNTLAQNHLYTKQIDNKYLAKDILNKVLTRSMEKEKIQPERTIIPKQYEDKSYETAIEMILKSNENENKSIKIMTEDIIIPTKSKTLNKDRQSEDEIFPIQKTQSQFYFGEPQNQDYDNIPDNDRYKLNTNNLKNLEIDKNQNMLTRNYTRPWLINKVDQLKTLPDSTNNEIRQYSSQPWTEENVTLRKVTMEKKTVQKEKNEEVRLKQLIKSTDDDINIIEENQNATLTDEPINEESERKLSKSKTLLNVGVKLAKETEIKKEDNLIDDNKGLILNNLSTKSRKTSTPWRDENVTLKKTTTIIKTIPKEEIEKVNIKSFKKPEIDENIDTTEI